MLLFIVSSTVFTRWAPHHERTRKDEPQPKFRRPAFVGRDVRRRGRVAHGIGDGVRTARNVDHEILRPLRDRL